MTDIVRIFETYAQNAGYEYLYGRDKVINLLDTSQSWTGLSDTIYFLHEFRRGERVDNNKMKYTGTFYFVLHSNINQGFWDEATDTVAEGKYAQNIEPFVNAYGALWNSYYCTQMEVLSTNFIDVTDFLDANLDGIKVDYSVQYINSFTG